MRPPFVAQAGDDDVRAAALQYVRKVAGMRAPSKANEKAFSRAVDEVARATGALLGSLVIAGAPLRRRRGRGRARPAGAPAEAASGR